MKERHTSWSAVDSLLNRDIDEFTPLDVGWTSHEEVGMTERNRCVVFDSNIFSSGLGVRAIPTPNSLEVLVKIEVRIDEYALSH